MLPQTGSPAEQRRCANRRRWLLRLGIALLCACLGRPAAAEVVTDGSLGPARDLTGPVYAISATLGRQIGSNLFHSFERFNLESGTTAAFTGPRTVEAIISRVTGGTPSSIDGTVSSSIPGADLFFLNPAGVMFGEHAALAVDGSVHIASADYLALSDGTRFNAAPAGGEVLTAAAPAAFGFLSAQPAPVQLQGSSLATADAATLSIVGGDVEIAAGPTLGSELAIPRAGRITLVGVGSTGEVRLADDNAQLQVHGPSGHVQIHDSRLTGTGGGAVFIRGGMLTLENAAILAGTRNSDGGPIDIAIAGDAMLRNTAITTGSASSGRGGDARVVVGGTLTLTEGSGVGTIAFADGDAGAVRVDAAAASLADVSVISSTVSEGARGSGNTVSISADRLEVASGSEVSASTLGAGNAGTVRLAVDEVVVTSNGLVASNAFPGSSGAGGDVQAQAGRLLLSEGGQVVAATFGAGDAGVVGVAVDEAIITGVGVDRSSGVFSTAQQGSSGQGGRVDIHAGRLEVSAGGVVSAGTFSSGNAGAVQVAAEQVAISTDASIGSNAEAGSSGAGGDVLVQADRLDLTQGGQVVAATFGPGTAGTVQLLVGQAHVSGAGTNRISGVFSTAQPSSLGNGGRIDVQADRLEVDGAARLSADTFGTGAAGTVEIRTGTTVVASDASVGSNANIGSSGAGGDVRVATTRLELRDGGQIAAATGANGDAGTVHISADTILIAGVGTQQASGVFSTAEPNSSGAGGNVEIVAARLEANGGGRVSANTFGSGHAGNVRIDTQALILQGSAGGVLASGITSDALGGGSGRGGNVDVLADTVRVSSGAEIAARTAGQGAAGNIRITAQSALVTLGGVVSSSAVVGSGGNGGDIDIQAAQLEVSAEAAVGASTFAGGNAGAVRIVTNSTVVQGDASIASNAERGSSGAGGDVMVATGRLELSGGGQIGAGTFGSGPAGTVTVDADEAVLSGLGELQFSGIFSTAEADSSGAGGNIELSARRLEINGGATLAATTRGSGDAGTVLVRADDILVTGTTEDGLGSDISTSTFGDGDGGDIEVQAQRLVVQADALITANVNAGSTGAGGDVQVQAARLELIQGGQIAAGTFGTGNAGAVRIMADTIVLSGVGVQQFSGFFSNAEADSSGAGGNIDIAANRLEVNGGATVSATTRATGPAGSIQVAAEEVLVIGRSEQDASSDISTSTFGSGAGGDIELQAGRLIVQADALITANVEQGSSGHGGDLRIQAGTVRLDTGGQLAAATFGSGNAGTVNMTADQVLVSGVGQRQFSGIFSSAEDGSSGAGGNIDIEANRLQVNGGATVSATTRGMGNAGAIDVAANELLVSGSAGGDEVSSISTSSAGSGDGGNIRLVAGQLTVESGAAIAADTDGAGDAGMLDIEADSVLVIGSNEQGFPSGIFSDALDNSTGNGGNIEIRSDQLALAAGGLIAASTFAAGAAGTVRVEGERIMIAGVSADGFSSGVYSTAEAGSTGIGGSLVIRAHQVVMQASGVISAESAGTGQAGDITIDTGTLAVRDGALVSTSADTADGGNVIVAARDFVYLAGSELSTAVGSGAGGGGNIRVDTVHIAASQSLISANAFGGPGGNLRLASEYFLASPDSVVSASSTLGVDGSVEITAPEIDLSGNLLALSSDFVGVANLLRDPCARRGAAPSSSFVVTGRGAVPPPPASLAAARPDALSHPWSDKIQADNAAAVYRHTLALRNDFLQCERRTAPSR